IVIPTGTFMPLNELVLVLMSFAMLTMFTPSGPRAGPRGGPGVHVPASTRTSTTSTISLQLLLDDADMVAAHGYGYRDHGLEQLDRDLLLGLVDLLHARLLALERARDELDDVALDDARTEGLGG